MDSKDDKNTNPDGLVEAADTSAESSTPNLSKATPEVAKESATSEVSTESAQSTPTPAPASAKPAPTAPLWAVATLGGVLVVLLIALFVNWNPWFGPKDGIPVLNGKAGRELAEQNDDKAAAAADACKIADRLFTYDYNNIDEFFNGVLDMSTGRFGEGFATDKEQLRQLFEQGQVVSKPADTNCTVEMMGDGIARVRMEGTQIVTSPVATQGQEQRENIEIFIDVQETDGTWKVYDLSPVQSGGSAGLPGGTTQAPSEPTPPADGQPVPGEQPAPEVPGNP